MEDTTESRLAACLQSLTEVDEAVAGGTLSQWYAVAVFDLPDGGKCLSRYTPESQPTWIDLGLLEFARKAQASEYFGDYEDDEE